MVNLRRNYRKILLGMLIEEFEEPAVIVYRIPERDYNDGC